MNGEWAGVNPRAARRALVFLILAGALLWFPLVRLLLGSPPGFLRDLGFFSGPGGTPLAWCLGLLVALLYSAYAIRNIPLVRQHWRAISLLKVLGIVVAVAAATVEEAFFRRVIMDIAMKAGWSGVAQVFASALVFGVAHGIWGIITGHVIAGVGTMIATGTIGAALALVYLVGDRSLAPVIVAHFIITATIQPGIMLAMFSGQMRRVAPDAPDA